MKRKIRIKVKRKLGTSLSHLIEIRHGDGGKVVSEKESWIEVVCAKNGHYKIVANNMTSDKESALSFSEWTNDVVNLDNEERSDAAWLKMSEKLQWREVILTPETIIAPNVKTLRQALKHVVFCAWDLEDM